MQQIRDSTPSAYWSVAEVHANAAIFFTLPGALCLALVTFWGLGKGRDGNR